MKEQNEVKIPASKNRLICLILIVLVGFHLYSCHRKQTSHSVNPPLRIGYSHWPGYLPIAIAREKGYFQEEGVGVELHFLHQLTLRRSYLSAGKIDGEFLTIGNALQIVQDTPGIRVIFAVDFSDGSDAIVAAPSIKKIEDLKGKPVGVTLGSFGELFLLKMLESRQMTPDMLILQNCQPAKVADLLAEGKIMAGQTWQPEITKVINAGGHVLFDSHQTPGLIVDVLAFDEKLLRERAGDIRAFLRAWLKAVDFCQAHPDEAMTIISQSEKIALEPTSLKGLQILRLEDNRRFFRRDNPSFSLYHTSQAYVDFFVKSGQLESQLDVNTIILPDFVNSP
jgi:NitT/TauT family transport system substrate-binding protein